MGRLLASWLRMGPERTRWTAPGGGVGAEARDGVRQPGVNGSEAEASSSARLPDGERRAEARVERERRRRAETGSRAETREGSGSSPDDMGGAESEALGAEPRPESESVWGWATWGRGRKYGRLSFVVGGRDFDRDARTTVSLKE